MASRKVFQSVVIWVLILGTTRGQMDVCRSLIHRCDRDEFIINGKRMVLFSLEKNWSDAREHCKSIGMQLLATRTKKDVDAIEKYLNNRIFGAGPFEHFNWNLWLDATDQAKEGEWKWITAGENLNLTYTTWGAGEPNGRNWENCLELMFISGYLTFWNDSKCNHRKRYICETRI